MRVLLRELFARAHSFAAGIGGLLREIGDENAYARHLKTHGLQHSGATWREFSDVRFSAKYRKGKCC